MDIDMDDNWGCVEPSELFSSTGKTQSLRFLVDQLTKNAELKTQPSHNNGIRSIDNDPWGATSVNGGNSPGSAGVSGSSSSSSTSEVQVVRKVAPKILKQKRGLANRTPNLKRVTFEVERFVADKLQSGSEKESAVAQLAIGLGATPPKAKGVNFKQLKANRQQSGGAQYNNVLDSDLLRSLNGTSKKIQKKSRGKGSGKKVTKKQLKKSKKANKK